MIEHLYHIYLNSNGVSIDSRSIKAGEIFFGLKGEQVDGNRFAKDALTKGASWVICDDPALALSGEKVMLVDDCLVALQELATYHRSHLSIPVIAITGSNGKTTTKELIAAVISNGFKTGYTQGNLNNHIGVPLTLLNQGRDASFLILEMGANHPGEIAKLCQIGKPTHGIITNIGRAHLEGFRDLQGVIDTKKELFDYLRANKGVVFVNASDPLLMELSEGQDRILYGADKQSLVGGQATGSDYFLELEWTLHEGDTSGYLKTKLTGIYNVSNVLAAMCVGRYFHLQTDVITQAIASYEPKNNRSQLIRTEHNTIIADAYNANPSSMEAALRHFKGLSAMKHLAILGDMLELGQQSRMEHSRILDLVTEMEVDQVILVGPEFTQAAIGRSYMTFQESDACYKWLLNNKITDHLILIKGSRGMRLEVVIPAL